VPVSGNGTLTLLLPLVTNVCTGVEVELAVLSREAESAAPKLTKFAVMLLNNVRGLPGLVNPVSVRLADNISGLAFPFVIST
jgi:hypothetical protein